MNYELGLRQIVLLIILVLVLGGIGGILMERWFLPYLSTVPLLRNLPILSPRTSLVITRREEIRINEGINNLEVVNRIKNSLAAVYLHKGKIGTKDFRFISQVSGLVASSDGIILAPLQNFRPEYSIAVALPNHELYSARLLAADDFTGLSFLKIAAADLPVMRQGTGREVSIGERLMAVWREGSADNVILRSVAAIGQNAPALGSLQEIYELSRPNSFLQTDLSVSPPLLGGVILNKDATLVGLVTQIGKDLEVLPVEYLKLALDNFFDDREIVWPSVKLAYQIFGETETRLFGLPKKSGALLKSAASPLREGDFIYAVDDQDLTAQHGLQHYLLTKKAGGDIARLKLLRGQSEIEVALKL